MIQKTLDDAVAHALREYPRESCGYVVQTMAGEVYLPCENQASSPENGFVIGAEDCITAEDTGDVIGVVHSHPGSGRAEASQPDKVSCEASGLPWHILAVHQDGLKAITTITPTGYVAPYVGREYCSGVLDCYTLCRDWYSREHNIALPEVQYKDEWWNDGVSDLYTAHFEGAGFVKLPEDEILRPGDAVLIQIRSKNDVPNHAGIIIEKNHMLHHPYQRLSRRDVYGGMWAHYTRLRLRHEKLR